MVSEFKLHKNCIYINNHINVPHIIIYYYLRDLFFNRSDIERWNLELLKYI